MFKVSQEDFWKHSIYLGTAGQLYLAAVECGLVQPNEQGKYLAEPFLTFWKEISNLIMYMPEEGTDEINNVINVLNRNGRKYV